MSDPNMTSETEKKDGVLAADAQRYKAMCDCDSATLERLLHPNFYYTHFSGWSEGKRGYIDRISAGKVKYIDPRTDSVVMDVYGETVVMHGHVEMGCYVIDEQRDVPLDNQFTSVWVKGDAGWQIVAWASTAVTESGRMRASLAAKAPQ